MSNDDELNNLTEKQLKYELFRALRRHESERAIAILKRPNVDPNWRHSYMGHSVLLISYFERDHAVFNYLLTRPDIDITIKDDDGRDIFYWMGVGSSDPDIYLQFKARLIEMKGSIGQKLHHAAEKNMRTLFVANEAKKLADPMNDPLSLNIGCRYLMRITFGPLKEGDIVTYNGTHTEPAERGHDTLDDFLLQNGKVVSLFSARSTVKESLSIYKDVDGDFDQYPKSIRSLIKALEYRSAATRAQAATTVTSPLTEIDLVVPILIKHALRERSENDFLKALCRVKKEALSLVEACATEPASAHSWGIEWILSKMGSLKYLASYHAMLTSVDPMLIRKAIAHIVNIADESSRIFLERIKDHDNFNVRHDVAKALESLTQNQ